MQFSDTSSKNGIIQRIEDALGYDDGTITGDSTLFQYVTSDVNEGYGRVAFAIRRAQDDWTWDDTNLSATDLNIATKPMTTSRYLRLNTTNQMYKVHRVDFTYDGTNYYEATPIEPATVSHGLGNDDAVDSNYIISQPRYDLRADLIGIYPRPTAAQVAAGAEVRVEYARAFDLFTTADTTQEPGFDRDFHYLIVLYAAMKRAAIRSAEAARNFKELYQEGLIELIEHYATKNEHSSIVATAKQNLGSFS